MGVPGGGKGGIMKELTQMRDAVVDALNAGGLAAMAAFPPGRAKAHAGPAAAVAVETAQGKAMGFCGYLGERYDPESGVSRELYGKMLEGVIVVDVRGNRAADCEAGCGTAAEILLGDLPSGIRPGELSWEALQWERETGMFLRRGRLQCRAVFAAESSGEEDVFLDFVLKGVMKN